MLFINWKKHFDVPNNIYSSNTLFKQSRKIKLYFLSNLVLKLVHNFCFRRTYYYYLDYLFNQRLLIASQTIINRFNKVYHFFNKSIKDVPYNTLYNTYIFFNSNNKRSTQINNIVKYLFVCFFFKTLSNNTLNTIYLYDKVVLLSLSYYLSIKNVILNVVLQKYFIQCNLLLHTTLCYKNKVQNKQSYSMNANVLSKLYVCKYKKDLLFNKKVYTFYKYKYLILLYTYIKHLLINSKSHNTNIVTNRINIIQQFKKSNSYNIYNNIKKTHTYTSIHFNIILKKIHSIMYFYFFSKKKTTLKYYNYLNYISFLNLKNKKSLLFYLKNTYTIFKNKMYYVLFKHRKSFIFFFNTILNKQNWLIGATNRIRLFRYINYVCNTIASSFQAVKFCNAPFNKKTISFFYNPLKIRTDLVRILGKRRYTKELIFLNNTKYILNYHLKIYYGITRKHLFKYYNALKSSYHLKTIKDVLFFFNYNLDHFLKTNLYNVNYNNIIFNNQYVKNIKSTFFLIGDYVQVKSNLVSLYDKYIIFFNFIYFVNPLKLNMKYNILHNIYTVLYNTLQKTLSMNNFRTVYSKNIINNFNYQNSSTIWNTFLLFTNKYINYRILSNNSWRKVNRWPGNVLKRTLIKQSLFYILKYKISFYKIFFSKNIITYKDLKYTYSFNKFFNKYKYIKFTKQYTLVNRTIFKHFKGNKLKHIKDKKRSRIQNRKPSNFSSLNYYAHNVLYNFSSFSSTNLNNFHGFQKTLTSKVSKNLVKILNKFRKTTYSPLGYSSVLRY